MDEIIETPTDIPRFSGKLNSIFPQDGTIDYGGEIGTPDQFPLTPLELAEVQSALGQ
jgi:hypothetical protein